VVYSFLGRAASTLIVLCLWTALAAASAFADGPFADKELRRWAEDYQAGKYEKVERSALRSLKSRSPHPYADFVWAKARLARGGHEAPWTSDLSGRAAERASLVAELIRLDAVDALGVGALLRTKTMQDVAALETTGSLMVVGWDAGDAQRPDLDEAAGIELLRKAPEDFLSVWQGYDLARDTVSGRAALKAYLDTSAEASSLRDTLLRRAYDRITWDDAEQLAVAKEWLAQYPEDRHALRYAADAAWGLARPEEAAAFVRRELEAFPFAVNWAFIAKILIRAEGVEAAEAFLNAHAQVQQATFPIDPDHAVLRNLVLGLIDEGNRGEARRRVEAALETAPSNAILNDLMARIELADGRPREALPHAEAAHAGGYRTMATYARLLESLRRVSDRDGFERVWTDLQERAGYATDTLWYERIQLFDRTPDEKVQTAEAAAAAAPLSEWMVRNAYLAQVGAGRKDDALDGLNAWLDATVPSHGTHANAAFNTLRDVHGSKSDEHKAAFAALEDKFGHLDRYWDLRADLEDGLDAKIALWRSVQAAKPDRFWPIKGEMSLLIEADRHTEAVALAERAKEKTYAAQVDKADALYEYAWAVSAARGAGQVGLDQATYDKALAVLDEAGTLGFSQNTLAFRRMWLGMGFQRYDDARAAMREGQRIAPDTTSFHLRSPAWTDSKLSIEAIDMAALYEYLQRAPFDGSRVADVAERHARWGGSKIFAAVLYEKLQSIDPDTARSNEALRWQNLGNLGDTAESFVRRYATTQVLGGSRRYIDWFETSRRKAREEATRIELDEETMSMVLYKPDGTIEKRREDARFGKLLEREVAGAWVRARYNERGQITGMESSDGRAVTLDYNDEGKITRLVESDRNGAGRELLFEYDPKLGKPVKIELTGKGSLNVTYKPDGEIDSVEGEAAPGSELDNARVSLEVTRAMQTLTGLANQVGSGQMPPPAERSAEILALEQGLWGEFQITRAVEAREDAALEKAIADYLTYLSMLAEKETGREGTMRRAQEAVRVLTPALDAGYGPEDAWPRIVSAMHTLYTGIFPLGLTEENWTRWTQLRAKLDTAPNTKALGEVRALLAKAPLQVLERARWLARSSLDNQGYWRVFEKADYAPRGLHSRLEGRSVLARANGDLLLGTNEGLFVRRKGAWTRYLWSDDFGSLRVAEGTARADAASEILSLAEDRDGRLWIGTANGLILLKAADQAGMPVAYDGEAQLWRSESEGLPSPRIEQLEAWRPGMLVRTKEGLIGFNERGPLPMPEAVRSRTITDVHVSYAVEQGERVDLAVLLSPQGVQILTESGAVIDRGPSRFEGFLTDGGGNFGYEGRTVYTVALDEQGGLSRKALPGLQDLLVSKAIYGLKRVRVGELDTSVLAILTDRGLGFFHDNYVEFKRLPFADREMPALALSQGALGLYVLSDDGRLYAHEAGRVKTYPSNGRVYDLVTDHEREVTYIARENALELMLHENADVPPTVVDRTSVRRLALMKDGRLVFADRSGGVFRFDPETAQSQLLFYARSQGESGWRASIEGLLVASDGTVWATQGASVFRWREGMQEAEELSFQIDPEKQPLPTDLMGRIVETVDGRILLSGSREPTRRAGRPMLGGMAEWDGEKFVVIGLGNSSEFRSVPWFMTGYTPVGEGKAIVGSQRGFGLHDGERLVTYQAMNDESYKRLLERVPNLFLGGRGVSLGEGIYLFPAAGGIVGWRKGFGDGQWFYPDRLNWLLPEQHLARYGARVTHAVETDASGRLYLGTDAGLTVYDSGGGDAVGFLMSEGLSDLAITVQEQSKLRQDREVFLNGLSADDPKAKLAREYLDLEEEAETLTYAAALEEQGVLPKRATGGAENERTGGQDGQERRETGAALRERLADKERRMRRLLSRLERESPGLSQLLELKPLDLAALRRDMPEDGVFLQFLPTEETLYIHLVSQRQMVVREISVRRSELFATIKEVRGLMQLEAAALARTRGGRIIRLSGEPVDPKFDPVQRKEILNARLAWLYDMLIAPVRGDLDGYERTYIVPAGPLAYVPYGALVSVPKSEVMQRPRYLVEDVTLGVVPSMYHLDLILRQEASLSEDLLVFGDPDGTLPGARAEAKRIEELRPQAVRVRIGDEATGRVLQEDGPYSRMIHLATHGVLDAERPEASYLVLGRGEKLSVIDIQLMDLSETDVVFLSACESGVGGEGLEYATLARAFAHAGVPAVVATLWKVDDKATLDLASQWYEAYEEDPVAALTTAQRAMLESEATWDPSAWSGFIAFGRAP